MKNLLPTAVILLMSASAFAWNPIAICENGNLVVDRGSNTGESGYQLVIKNPGDTGFVQFFGQNDLNFKSELVVPLSSSQGLLVGKSSGTGKDVKVAIDQNHASVSVAFSSANFEIRTCSFPAQ